MRFSSFAAPFKFLTVFALLGFLFACASDVKEELVPEEPVDELYNKALDSLNSGEYKDAAKHFAEVDRQHPYSQWAARAEIMEAYAFYQNMDYDEAVKALDQFIELHPGHSDIGYAYYLRALCHYERILDVRRDQAYARDAQKGLQDVVNRFPDSDYAKDAVLKIALINDHLAGAEMQVGRYYIKQHLYIAAIGRFRAVVDKFQTTSHVPEALLRLVECYAALGMLDEAKKNAAVLGHNFPGSEWYQDAYNLLRERGVSIENPK